MGTGRAQAGSTRLSSVGLNHHVRQLSCWCGPLAHPEEQGTFNPKVPGSRPGRPTASTRPVRVPGESRQLLAGDWNAAPSLDCRTRVER